MVNVSMDILYVRKYCQLLTHKSNTSSLRKHSKTQLKPSKTSPFPWARVPPSNTPMSGSTPLTNRNGGSIASRNLVQLRNKVLTGYTGMPHIHSKTAPSHGVIANPNYVPHLWTQPTHHPKRHPDPISRFSTMHLTDRPTDRHWSRQQNLYQHQLTLY